MTEDTTATQLDPPAVGPPPVPKRRWRWGFRTGTLGVLALLVWGELAMTLVHGLEETDGPGRWIYALGAFFLSLPLLAAVVYGFPLVVSFFRSIRVGVVNLILIGLGSIIGVLFHQEDPNFPLDRAGMQQLEHWQQQPKPWSPGMRQAYRYYLDFRNAHAFFTYHLLHGLGFHTLGIGADECRVDERDIQAKMDVLAKRLPELRDRFGEEFSVAMSSSSEAGLRNRAMNAEITVFEQDANDFFWSLFVWADRLDLIRVYKSDWFAVCFAILFLGVLSNLFRGGWRRLLRPGKLGFVFAHVGVMLIIGGAFYGRLTEERGILDLHVGDVKDRFQLYSGPRVPLQRPGIFGTKLRAGEPFALRLDAFRADYFDVLDVWYAKEDEQGRLDFEFALGNQPKFRVWEGFHEELDWGPAPAGVAAGRGSPERIPYLVLDVEEYIPQARIRSEVRRAEGGTGTGHPLAQVVVTGPDGRQQSQLLSPLFDVPLVHGPSGARIRYLLADSAGAARERLLEEVPSRLGILRQMGAEGVGPGEPLDVIPGASFAMHVEDRQYRVQVIEATPQLRLGRDANGRMSYERPDAPLEDLEPLNPAVHLQIEGPGGEVEDRWVMEQDFHGQPPRFQELRLEFTWDRWAAPARHRLLLLQLPDDSLLAGAMGDPESLQPLGLGEPLPLGRGWSLAVDSAFRQGYLERIPEPVAGADFFHPAPAAIRLRVTTPDGESRFVLVGGEDERDPQRRQRVDYTGPDGEQRIVFLQFRPDLEGLPFEWRSKLTALRAAPGHEMEEVAAGVIRVNDYFVYDGFRFFQTNARANDPSYSGIGVVYDPGIPTVLAGLYMVMFGAAVAFLVNPLLTRRVRGL